jgi:hypothetical protein
MHLRWFEYKAPSPAQDEGDQLVVPPAFAVLNTQPHWGDNGSRRPSYGRARPLRRRPAGLNGHPERTSPAGLPARTERRLSAKVTGYCSPGWSFDEGIIPEPIGMSRLGLRFGRKFGHPHGKVVLAGWRPRRGDTCTAPNALRQAVGAVRQADIEPVELTMRAGLKPRAEFVEVLRTGATQPAFSA